MPATDCVQLDNWLVRTQAVQTRLGAINWTTGFSAPVESLLPYEAPVGSNDRLFAAAGTSIFDATNSGAVGAAVQTGLTNARWQHTNYSNSAGNFLIILNGADSYRHWNGTAWTSVANFTLQPGATPFATTQLVQVNVYRNRLFFAANAELAFYYLDAGAISGDVRRFQVGQIFRRGGFVVATSTWTIDAGDGADDHLVVVSSEGEVAVYKGGDPSSATDWLLVGVFYIGRPLGRRPFMKFGGDLLMLTDRGLFPVSKALSSASIERNIALTDKIDEVFRQKGSSLFSTFGWELTLHTSQSFLLVNVPDAQPQQYVMDLITGSWSRFLGWNARCFAYFNGELYYGDSTRTVKAFTGPNDFGVAIQADMLTGYNYFGSRGFNKHVELLRPTFLATGAFAFQLSLLSDFQRQLPPATLSSSPISAALWDSALWDASFWGSDFSLSQQWRTIFNNPGYNFGLGISLSSSTITAQLLAVDYILSRGDSL